MKISFDPDIVVMHMNEWYKENGWCTSQHNWASEVRRELSRMPAKVPICDITLAEGVEQPGVACSTDELVEIARRVKSLGVSQFLLPFAAAQEESFDLVKSLSEAKLGVPLIAWARLRADDLEREVDKCVEAGADWLRSGGGYTSKWTLRAARPEISLDQLCERIKKTIKYAKECNVKYEFGTTDMTRTDFEVTRRMYEVAEQAGADRYVLYDTFGAMTPPGMRYVVRELKKIIGEDADLVIHTHNDYGLAVANAIAAIEVGATICDLSVNGLGDRAGNCPMEETVCALEMLYGVRTGIDLSKMYEVSQFVQDTTRITLQPHKAIVGANAFMEQSELHVTGILTGGASGLWNAWHSINPALLGRKHVPVWGPSTLEGISVKLKLDRMGLRYTDKDVSEIRSRIKQLYNSKTHDRYVTEQELEAIAREVLSRQV